MALRDLSKSQIMKNFMKIEGLKVLHLPFDLHKKEGKSKICFGKRLNR